MGRNLHDENGASAASHSRASRIRRLGAVAASAVMALVVSVLLAPAASAEASVSVSEQTVAVTNFPVQLVGCVNSGNGEVVLINGSLHTVTALRDDADGGFHVTTHANLADTSGLGIVSGDTYRVTDTAGGFGQRLSLYFPSANAPPQSVTQSRDVRFISVGSADNLLLRFTVHQTINANGELTVQNVTIEQICVG
jgi:hypothetical protein